MFGSNASFGDNESENDKKVLKELLVYFEEILPGCNPYVSSYLACKEISEEATGLFDLRILVKA